MLVECKERICFSPSPTTAIFWSLVDMLTLACPLFGVRCLATRREFSPDVEPTQRRGGEGWEAEWGGKAGGGNDGEINMEAEDKPSE